MKTDEEIVWENISQTLYWFECAECDYKTNDYLQSYFHMAKTEHLRQVKSVPLATISQLLSST